jgi:hypothetical protein
VIQPLLLDLRDDVHHEIPEVVRFGTCRSGVGQRIMESWPEGVGLDADLFMWAEDATAGRAIGEAIRRWAEDRWS